jgi:hypothetical protein
MEGVLPQGIWDVLIMTSPDFGPGKLPHSVPKGKGKFSLPPVGN